MEKQMVESREDVLERLGRVLSTSEKKRLGELFVDDEEEEGYEHCREEFCSPEAILRNELSNTIGRTRDRLGHYIEQLEGFAEMIRDEDIELPLLEKVFGDHGGAGGYVKELRRRARTAKRYANRLLHRLHNWDRAFLREDKHR
jgi:hypothetical protein